MMVPFLLSFVVASHNPYHWTMSCERWRERAQEIMLDQNLSLRAKQHLILYLRTKVEGPCPRTVQANMRLKYQSPATYQL
tara:strand:- start:2714 stop:2953 length:240 start_codon:yes stop_codon:yes gene_type:complete